MNQGRRDGGRKLGRDRGFVEKTLHDERARDKDASFGWHAAPIIR